MPQDNIEAIKAKVDVVDLVQEYVQIKPAGTNNFKGLCPFHHEKTPSFMVSKDKQIWHCFGCGEGGDIFGFVQKMEGMEFPEALRHLAQKAGIELEYQDPKIRNQKTTLLDINKAAAELYHKILVEHPKAKFVLDYLEKRGITKEAISHWNLGFAPEGTDTLNRYLLEKKKFKGEDVFLAWLTLKKDRGVGYFDRFRNRLMFPIWDTHGNVIGFGGRWLGPEKDVAKYINSPQTLVYNKSHVLYGIDKAKQEIKKQKQAVVVEGYMDCLASHQAGITNVVAASGTALTLEQVKLLKRFTTNIAFAFDQDVAGDTASKRGIAVAWQEDMTTTVITLPEGKDPDDLIRSDAKAWPKAIAAAQPVMEYYFDSTLRSHDLAKVEDKKTVAKILLPVMASLADPIEQTHYVQKLATVLKVEEEVLRDKLKQLITKETPTKETKETAAEKPASDRFSQLAERLIGIVLNRPEYLNTISAQLLPEYITHDTSQQLYKLLVVYYTKNHNFDYSGFIQTLPTEGQNLATYADILSMKVSQDLDDLDDSAVEQEIIRGAQALKKHFIQQQLKDIEQKIKRAESEANSELVEELTHQLADLATELHQVT